MQLPILRKARFAAAANPRREKRKIITVSPGRKLGLGYDDQAVVELAAQDGRSAFNTDRWGPGNRSLHGLLAVLITAITHAAAIRVKLEEVLAGIAVAYALKRQQFKTDLSAAHDALTWVALAAARRRALMQKLQALSLEEPTARWLVMIVLGLLIIGDLTMSSAAMAVLNIPDTPFVSWLPFSELHLAAMATVVGMIGAAHWLGESLKAHHYEKDLRSVLKVIAGVSLTGGLCLAVSVAVIRTAYLNANGVPALTGAFVAMQAGLLGVAVAASARSAHPYRAEWRRMERQERQADKQYKPARQRAGQQAAAVNALVAQWGHEVTAARAGAEAVSSDVVRQGHLYIRELQHGQPEPTQEELYAGDLPVPVWPAGVQELLNYPKVTEGSSLAAPELVNLDDLDKAREKLRWRDTTLSSADDSGKSDEPEPEPLHPVVAGAA